MRHVLYFAVLALSLAPAAAQSPAAGPKFDAFEVATIKPVTPDAKAGRYIKMDGTHRFIAKNYTLKLLIAAAYDLNSRTISGGPKWIDSDHFDILAITPGDARPTRPEQMAMLRDLLMERFKLAFHRKDHVFSIYELTALSGAPKLKQHGSSGRPRCPDQHRLSAEDRLAGAQRQPGRSRLAVAKGDPGQAGREQDGPDGKV